MKSLKIPMTIDEFHLTEFPFGWRDEYADGFAYVSPREYGILMKMPVEKRKAQTFAEIQPVSCATFEELAELFYASFVDSVEFCNQTKTQIRKQATKNLRNFFDGERGIPQLDLSCIAVLPELKKEVVGACLISKYKYGFKNEILFVHPKWQGKGVGSALVSSVLNNLHERGEKIFWSEYHICNEQSGKWHEKFGFVEEPEIMTTKFRRSYLRHQIWRNEQLGNGQKAEELKLSLASVEATLKQLEELEKKDSGAAWLSWKYDY